MTALRPPIAPMLARLARHLPRDGYLYEPKWDGFRSLAFRDGHSIDLRSRHDRPLGRYFPEVVAALGRLREDRFVLDGELVVLGPKGAAFEALLRRLHPAASRVRRLAEEEPASFIVFDLLACGDEDLRGAGFARRRERLESILAGAERPIFLTSATEEPEVAEAWLERFQGRGVDGVVAKHEDLPYREGKRAMVKVKVERTADCVVAGVRPRVDDPVVASLLLGLYDETGALQHVGVSSSFPEAQRAELMEDLRPLETSLEGHPWERGYLVGGGALGRLKGSAGRWTPDMERDWLPIRPERVCEVAFDQVDARRFRHPARFKRWRPDREPRSCLVQQLDLPPAPAHELVERP